MSERLTRMKRVLVLESLHPEGVERLRAHFEVQISLETPPGLLRELVTQTSALVIRSRTRVDGALIDCAPHLEVIGRAGTGTDNIDVAYAQHRGVRVITVPDGNAVSVAEFTVLQILALCRQLPALLGAVEAHDFRREAYQGRELSTQIVGIVGVGRIGSLVAQRLRPFGCRVMGYDINPALRGRFRELGVEWTEALDEVLRTADVLTLHVPKTPQTMGMIAVPQLRLMKRSSLLVNTSRGGIIQEADLLQAVNEGQIAGAAIDVLEDEPPLDAPPPQAAYQNPLLHHPRIIISPHCAASTEEAQRAIALSLADHLVRELEARELVAPPETT